MVRTEKEVKLTRKELYDMLTDRPVPKVADELGVSASMLRKVCQNFIVPYRGAGEWGLLQHGLEAKREPLRGVPDKMVAIPYKREWTSRGKKKKGKKGQTNQKVTKSVELESTDGADEEMLSVPVRKFESKQAYTEQILQKQKEIDLLYAQANASEAKDQMYALLDAIGDELTVYLRLRDFTVDESRIIGLYIANNFDIVVDLAMQDAKEKNIEIKPVHKKEIQEIIVEEVVEGESESSDDPATEETLVTAIVVEQPVSDVDPQLEEVAEEVSEQTDLKPELVPDPVVEKEPQNEFTCVPDGEYIMRDNVKSWDRPVQVKLVKRGGWWTLKQGSIVCPNCVKTDKQNEQIEALRERYASVINGNRTKKDIKFESPAVAAAFCFGYTVDVWKSVRSVKDKIRLRETLEFYNKASK